MSFRAQLVLEEQRLLYDVWKSAASGDLMPSRQKFSPCAFGALLPFVSLIEFSNNDMLPKVRVAGSLLRGVFGANPHDELLRDDIDGSLNSIFSVRDTKKPISGAVQSDSIGNAGQMRFWLRMPLGVGGIVDSVIGLDLTLSGVKVPNWSIGQSMASGK